MSFPETANGLCVGPALIAYRGCSTRSVRPSRPRVTWLEIREPSCTSTDRMVEFENATLMARTRFHRKDRRRVGEVRICSERILELPARQGIRTCSSGSRNGITNDNSKPVSPRETSRTARPRNSWKRCPNGLVRAGRGSDADCQPAVLRDVGFASAARPTQEQQASHHLTDSQAPTHPCRQARTYSATGSRSMMSPLLPRSTIG